MHYYKEKKVRNRSSYSRIPIEKFWITKILDSAGNKWFLLTTFGKDVERAVTIIPVVQLLPGAVVKQI